MDIIHARLYTMAGPVIEDGYLKIRDGVIAQLGSMEEYRPGPQTPLDVKGNLVCPGFVDAHTHLGVWEDMLDREDDTNECTDPCTPQLRGLDAVNPLDPCFREALLAGVTTVITGPGSANPIGGQMCAIKTWGRRVDDMVLREPLAIKFAFGENPKNVYQENNQTPTTRMATAAIIREELKKAQRYWEDVQRSQEDEEMDPPEFDFKCEALIPLLERKIQAHMHAHRTDDIFTAIRIAKEFHLDYVLVHATAGHTAADLLRGENARVISGPFLESRTKPELADLSVSNPVRLIEAGVPTAICTDHPCKPQQLLGLCAAYTVREGMDPMQALACITSTPAQICGLDSRVGSLVVGGDADLQVYEMDPLSLMARPSMVILGGKLVVKDSKLVQ